MNSKQQYHCTNCGSTDVRQHAHIMATVMLSVNTNEAPTFIDHSVKQRGHFECFDCGIRWNKPEEGEWR